MCDPCYDEIIAAKRRASDDDLMMLQQALGMPIPKEFADYLRPGCHALACVGMLSFALHLQFSDARGTS